MLDFIPLEPISFNQYKTSTRKFRIPDPQHPFPKNSTFRLRRRVTESFDSLIDSYVEDPTTRVELLWFPEGLLRIGQAYARTRKDPTYLDYLKERLYIESRFLVRVKHRDVTYRRPTSTFDETHDNFDYVKDRGLWVLRRIVIGHQNLGKYSFTSGLDTFTGIYMVAAVHDEPI